MRQWLDYERYRVANLQGGRYAVFDTERGRIVMTFDRFEDAEEYAALANEDDRVN